MRNESLITIVVIGIVIMLFSWLTPYDDTDDEASKERSGMVLFTDYGTGCQYVGTGQIWGNSSLTPRLDSNGNQVCGLNTGE